jgi:hypothetical protein
MGVRSVHPRPRGWEHNGERRGPTRNRHPVCAARSVTRGAAAWQRPGQRGSYRAARSPSGARLRGTRADCRPAGAGARLRCAGAGAGFGLAGGGADAGFTGAGAGFGLAGGGADAGFTGAGAGRRLATGGSDGGFARPWADGSLGCARARLRFAGSRADVRFAGTGGDVRLGRAGGDFGLAGSRAGLRLAGRRGTGHCGVVWLLVRVRCGRRNTTDGGGRDHCGDCYDPHGPAMGTFVAQDISSTAGARSGPLRRKTSEPRRGWPLSMKKRVIQITRFPRPSRAAGCGSPLSRQLTEPLHGVRLRTGEPAPVSRRVRRARNSAASVAALWTLRCRGVLGRGTQVGSARRSIMEATDFAYRLRRRRTRCPPGPASRHGRGTRRRIPRGGR